jgi:hypothetical protein
VDQWETNHGQADGLSARVVFWSRSGHLLDKANRSNYVLLAAVSVWALRMLADPSTDWLSSDQAQLALYKRPPQLLR